MDDAIKNFMTSGVHTIASQRTLADAHAMMREHRIRHLPVLKRGKLLGIVTQRDLSLVEGLRGVDPTQVTVDDAMSEDVFAVAPETPLATVAQKMARAKYGSVVVMQGGKVVGIFTAVDALLALDFLMSSPAVCEALHRALVPAPELKVS